MIKSDRFISLATVSWVLRCSSAPFLDVWNHKENQTEHSPKEISVWRAVPFFFVALVGKDFHETQKSQVEIPSLKVIANLHLKTDG